MASKLQSYVAKTYSEAHDLHWRYGDSHGTPPCSDGVISCDRLVARALWDMNPKFRDQKIGGMTVMNAEVYLLGKGAEKITDPTKIKAGDIILMSENGHPKADDKWHMYFCIKYDPKTGICSKYDCGSQDRINAQQPFVNVHLNEWPTHRKFYCAFRIPEGKAAPAVDDKMAFDSDFYKYAYPDIVKAVGTSAAALRKHWTTYGKKEGRMGNVIYTPSFYKSKYADLRNTYKKNWEAYANHFCSYGVKEGRVASHIFDPKFYKEKYKDLSKAYGNDWKKYYEHFLQFGMKEGRQGSKEFDPRKYAERYSDLKKLFGTNWKKYYNHYMVYGMKEKRKGN